MCFVRCFHISEQHTYLGTPKYGKRGSLLIKLNKLQCFTFVLFCYFLRKNIPDIFNIWSINNKLMLLFSLYLKCTIYTIYTKGISIFNILFLFSSFNNLLYRFFIISAVPSLQRWFVLCYITIFQSYLAEPKESNISDCPVMNESCYKHQCVENLVRLKPDKLFCMK